MTEDIIRHRSPAHLRWVRRLPCLACSAHTFSMWPDLYWRRVLTSGVSVRCHAHHLTIAQPKARGLKAGDQFVVPLCPFHHDAQFPESVHRRGDERAWWAALGLDPMPIAERLWMITCERERA